MFRFGRLLFQFLDRIGLFFRYRICGRKVVFNIHAETVLSLDRQIANVSLGGNNAVPTAEILLNGLGF